MEEILNDTISPQELEVSKKFRHCEIAPHLVSVWVINFLFVYANVNICIIQKFEKIYMKELTDKKCVSAKTQFEYAWCLIRSKYGADINNGIKIFEGLSKDNPDDKRDYIYYLAIAYVRIKDFPTSQKYVKAFLEIEPNNQQVLLLDVSSNIRQHHFRLITNFRHFPGIHWQRDEQRV